MTADKQVGTDFYGKPISEGDLVQLDQTLTVATVLGNQVVLTGRGITVLVPGNKCVLLDEGKLREEIAR